MSHEIAYSEELQTFLIFEQRYDETHAECRYMNVFISGANGFFEHI